VLASNSLSAVVKALINYNLLSSHSRALAHVLFNFDFYHEEATSRDSSVGIATRLRVGRGCSRVRFPAGMGIFIFITASRMFLGPTQPPIQ
jgi:hypothetical protein